MSKAINVTFPTLEEASAVPVGQGIPSGGTTGQMLNKASDGDYDVVWSNVPDQHEPKSTTIMLGTSGWTSTTIYLDYVYAPGIDDSNRVNYYTYAVKTVPCSIVTENTAIVKIGLGNYDGVGPTDTLMAAWALISGPYAFVNQGDGSLTFYALDIPEVDVPVYVEVM